MDTNPSRVMVFPDGGNANNGNVPAWILPFMGGNWNNGGLFGGNNGFGGGILGFLLGLMFGNNGFFGNGFFGGGNNNGAGFLSNQINNDTGRELLMQAVTSQGEQSRQAIQTLSTMLGQDFNLVNSNVQVLQNAINQIANAQGINALQVINSIQAGNASLSRQLCECCCENRQAIAQQTATIQAGINGIQNQMAINQGRDDLNVCQQTYQLTDTNNRNTQSIIDKLSQMETRALQDKLEAARDENNILRGQVSRTEQTQQFGAMLNSVVAPIIARQQVMDDKIDAIASKQPNTVPVQWPQLTAVNTTPYVNGGFYGNGWSGGFFGGNNIVF